MSLFVHRNAGGRCPCGAANAACGPPSSVVPVDQIIEEVAAVSGPLKKYRVRTQNGVDTVMKLSDADAEKLRGAGSPYEVVDGASTIEPVALATGSGDDNGAPAVPANPAVVMAEAGGHAGPGMADGVPVTEPVQPPADPGDDQEQGGPQPPADDVPQVHPAAPEPQPAPEPVKAPAKKRAPSANKARPAAENKVGG